MLKLKRNRIPSQGLLMVQVDTTFCTFCIDFFCSFENLVTLKTGVEGPFWLSGNDLGIVNNWYWLSNGHRITYFNWNAANRNGPNASNSNERCIALSAKTNQYRWNHEPCVENQCLRNGGKGDSYSAYNFICEIKLTIN